MAIFSEMELSEFDNVMKQTAESAKKGKKPSLSAVLMSLQFATVLQNDDGKLWFEDKMNAFLIIMSVRKLMEENTPDMFSVPEKAFMMSIINTGKLLLAIDASGMDLGGYFTDADGNRLPEEDSDEE